MKRKATIRKRPGPVPTPDGEAKQRDRRLSARYRIKTTGEIRRLFEGGRATADGVLVLRALKNPDLPVRARVAVIVSKRHGGAVVRNRTKRLCREAFRRVRDDLPGGYDYVLLPRAGVPLSVEKVARSLRGLVARASGRKGERE